MTDQNRALARRWFEEVWNQRREATIDELADPTALIHGLGEGGRDLIGPEGFRPFFRAFSAAFPDFRVAVDDVLADGDQTATRITFTGTHTGNGLGIPPTGRRVRSTGIIICRWRNGRIIEGWNEFDAAGMMQQLQPPPGNLKLRA
jgi:steroid delta-isomerase-like uncharacterized protein